MKKIIPLFLFLGFILFSLFYFKNSLTVVPVRGAQDPPASYSETGGDNFNFVSLSQKAESDWQAGAGFTRNIGLGDRGPDVALLQEVLPGLTPVYPKNWPATGYFGPLTKEAVENFQLNYDLQPTGYVDPETVAVLTKILTHNLCPIPDAPYPDLWLSIVDKNHPLPFEYYVPNDLVDISGAVKTAGQPLCLSDKAAPALEAMIEDAGKAGIQIEVDSGFRGINSQSSAFIYWIESEGSRAIDESAFPGYSEHQLGTAVDLTGASINWSPVDPRFGDSPEGKWLEANAYKYGFVMSYPENEENITGYTYEPWHWRYLGPGIASAIHNFNLPPVSYLTALSYK
ncbi:MAG TPA: D-alanyl-D-alanine carboxypeptidase family protein [Candidatus Tyrphobacter sp.]|nr:D-alanyl-D-alanine carboxypeptidase family protein [Candidatus Tyrphobacter sp.]